MARRRINYREGTCFFVPLRDRGFARGVVARCDGKGGLLAYFFGPRLNAPDSSFDELAPEASVLIGLCGDSGLLNGEWPQAGEIDGWKREAWPFPPMFREDEAAGRAWLSHYDEDSLEVICEEPVTSDRRNMYPYDRLMGYGAAEIRLTKLLANI